VRLAAAAVAAVLVLGVVAAGAGTSGAPRAAPTGSTGPAATPAPAGPHGPPYAVGERVITFVDPSRTVRFPGRPPEPRTLVTVVRYPTVGPASRVDVRNAPLDRADGPFPLVVFGHGFAVTPAVYYRLLRAWAQAGYVVAAPVFPLENGHAPGGPDESDLINEPGDMSDVISGMLATSANPHGALAGAVDSREIAVSGQSDGGEAALAVAYDRQFLDARVRAAVILSGARIPGAKALWFPRGAPPLLATQGTADIINLPKFTYAFFGLARSPKYLLRLIGAPHLPPYTSEQPQLGIVERVSTEFLNRYLKADGSAAGQMTNDGDRGGMAVLTARP
jgi:predicted dienelactone hydrolase